MGIQTNLKCLLHQPSLRRSEKNVSSLISLLLRMIALERGKGMGEVMRQRGCLAALQRDPPLV